MVVDDCTIWFPHLFGLFNRFIWKFERRTFFFFFFFASALEMASQCPVVGQLNQRFLKMASLTSIITIFTWYIVFPDKFYLFLDLRKYIPSFTIRLFFKIQRILKFFVWELHFINFIKSVLNDSRDFTSLNWRSLYPKIAFVPLLGYPVFRLLRNTWIPIYLSILTLTSFQGRLNIFAVTGTMVSSSTFEVSNIDR